MNSASRVAAGYPFSRRSRLLTAADFARVFKQAQRSSDRYFTVLATAAGNDSARLGLAISKKSLRRAHDRNRVKRLVRESFRHHQLTLNGLDLVVMAKRGLEVVPNAELAGALQNHWLRLIKKCGVS